MIHQIFPVLTYKTKFIRDINNVELSVFKKILEKLKPNELNNTSEESSVLDKHQELCEIKEFIEAHINQYAMHLYAPNRRQHFSITQSWLNINKKGDSHHLHNHPNSMISGVFYIECIEKDSIIFKNPNLLPQQFVLNQTQHHGSYNVFPISQLDLILFPSWLEHKVSKNETDGERISLSFNTKFKGKAGIKDSLTYNNFK